jgi:hypothetical protein
MPYYEDVIAVAILIQQLLKILESGFGNKAVGLHDSSLVPGLSGDQICRLKAALERA